MGGKPKQVYPYATHSVSVVCLIECAAYLGPAPKVAARGVESDIMQLIWLVFLKRKIKAVGCFCVNQIENRNAVVGKFYCAAVNSELGKAKQFFGKVELGNVYNAK